MRYFDHVVVGLANTAADRGLLRYARLVHQMGRGESRFTFVHVIDPHQLPRRSDAPAPTMAAARAALQSVVAEEFGTQASHDVTVSDGNLVDTLLAELAQAKADLVMVGHRRDGRGRRSFSRRLALKAPCSVWMVPEGSEPRVTSVLAAVDLSLPSAQALSVAALVADRAGQGKCTALHVQEPSALGFDAVEQDSARRALEQFIAPLELHDVEVVPRVEEAGSVAGAVSAQVAAAGHDLVVVGTRGRSPSAAVLLGSESEEVLMSSKVPVLITKEAGGRIGLVKALLEGDFHGHSQARFG
jgi:nucleotide-binding universal stress UspA family protein